MTDVLADEVNKVCREAECLLDAQALSDALDALAKDITIKFQDKVPVVLSVMNGAMIPTTQLLLRLRFPLQLDYIHATRYGDELHGGELRWIAKPETPLSARHVLIIDDIFDQGVTLEKIAEYCQSQNAASVSSCVIIEKMHDRKTRYTPEFVGLQVPDRYVFGFGMDYKGYLRNMNGVYAVKGS